MNTDELINYPGDHYAAMDALDRHIKGEAKMAYPDSPSTQYASSYGHLTTICAELIRRLKTRAEVKPIRPKPTLKELEIEDGLLSFGSREVPSSITVRYKPEITGITFPFIRSVEIWEVLFGESDIMQSLSTEEISWLEEMALEDYERRMEEDKTEFELRKAEV